MAFVQKIKPKHNPNIYATLQLFLVFIKKKPFQILISILLSSSGSLGIGSMSSQCGLIREQKSCKAELAV